MKVTKLGLTLCDPVDYRVHGILQARILEWVTLPFSRGSPQLRDRTQVSCIAGRFFNSEIEFPMWSNTLRSQSGPLFSFCLETSLLEPRAPLWSGLCVLGLKHTHHSGTSLSFTEPLASVQCRHQRFRDEGAESLSSRASNLAGRARETCLQ